MIIGDPSDYDTLTYSEHKIKANSEVLRGELVIIHEAFSNVNKIFNKANYIPYIKTYIALYEKLDITANTIEANLKAFEEYADMLGNLECKYRELEEEIVLKSKDLFISDFVK